ncbi:hypothetical protein ABW20_dc0103553 [Dactylellina cionopaga]|nr:hypothetical protein ABW20_dc0103553 [Dactylellina cionopaga]
MADIGELLDIIKDECALTVTQGLPVTSVWKLVTEHLESDKTVAVPLEILDPTVPNPATSYHPPLPLDVSLRSNIWNAIRQDQDISIGINDEGKNLSFDDAEAGRDAKSQPHEKGKPAEWRLFASERLQWRRIAGHDIDTVRLFPTLWQLLKIIAMNKEDGILQPQLTTLSGQDARSVGPRTKDLAGKGYIMKIPVIANKMRTSKLILKRFYKEAMEKRRTQKKKRLATIKKHAKTGKKLPKELLEEPLDIEEVISGIFKLLKSAKNKVMLIEDLKFRLNCTSTRSRRKACRRIMGKLEVMGCIQKIRAMGSENMHAKKFDMGPVDEEDLANLKNTRFAKCVKFVRDLRPLEWQEAVRGVRPTATQEEGEFDEVDSDEEQDDGYRVTRTAPPVRVIDGRRVTIPLWRRTHLMHTIYDQIFASGMEGIRSGMLSNAVFGPFYYRPFDQIMGRWTTNSLQNQPDHLKSTSIVRETDMYQRTANYRYWTTEGFQAMLKDKDIDYEPTNAAANAYKIGKKTKKKAKNFEKIPMEESKTLDENGFMAINTTKFVKGDGRGSFQDCQNAAPKKGSGLKPPGISPLKGRKRVKFEHIGDGGERPKAKKRAPKRQNEDQVDVQNNETAPQEEEAFVVIGRKRKYPPGTEPYLKDGPRVEAVKKALKLGSIKEVLADGKPLTSEELPDGFQPLSAIDESSWTVEMVAERTFLDLVESKTYQIPLATARYRTTHAKKGRPKKNGEAPTPELLHLGPIFQPGPDGPVEITPTTAPDLNTDSSKPTKRPYKRRKVTQAPGEEAAEMHPVTEATEQSVDTAFTSTIQEETTSIRRTKRATAGKKKKNLGDGDDSDASITKGASRRRSRGKETPVKTPPSKKAKKGTRDGPIVLPDESTIVEAMDIDDPLVNEPSAIVLSVEAGDSIAVDFNPKTASIETGGLEASLPTKIAFEDNLSTVVAKPKSGDKELVHVTKVNEPTSAPEKDQVGFALMEVDIDVTPNGIHTTDAAHEPNSTKNSLTPVEVIDLEAEEPLASTEDTPEPLAPPKLEPFTDSNGVRLELLRAEIRKNRSIGGVLRASRRRLLMGMLTSVGGAISINAGYRRFVHYVKEQKGQTSTMDRKTFNSIIDDTNMDGKLFVIGVFRSNRRIGTIIAMPDLTFQSQKVEESKRVVVDELDKPFAWKQNVSKGIAAKISNIPIERIDFERYSYAGKAISLGNSSTRRRLDAEKMSTLARLQAITENEKKEEGTSGKGKGRRRATRKEAQPITSRTRSKTAITASSAVSEASSDISGPLSTEQADAQRRSRGKARREVDADEDSEEVDVPGETLHRWQIPRANPSLYPEHTTNFPPYTVPETGNFGYGSYSTYEDYAAASAARNELEAGYGRLQVEGYKPIRPKRRQQAGGRAGRPRAMMTNEREINPDLLPLIPDQPKEAKKRGRKVKEPAAPKEPKPPKEKRPPKPRAQRITRPKEVPRIRTTLEEDETLTLAIIIIRTLFGGYVRSIKWDLVAKALPQYDRWSIQSHWPRVRAKMKDEIPEYQAEFEEQYLRAFYKGALPFFDKNRGVEFDLLWHVNWLRPLVKNIRPVTERKILPDTRVQLESMYEVTSAPLDWRRDFFNYMTTMSWKEHQLRNHSSATLIKEEEENDGVISTFDKRKVIERAKHSWRSIFITEDERYDEDKAKVLMKVHTQQASAAALTELHKVDRFIIRSKKGGRFGTASAQARVLQPWRTGFATSIFGEAKGFHENVTEQFKDGGNEYKLVVTGLSSGHMAWIVDRLVIGEIGIYTKDYKVTSRGLSESLVTRAINPLLFHFDIFVANAREDVIIPRPNLEPANLFDEVPQGSMKEVAFPPFIWQNMHDEVIGYMWKRVVRCVLAVVVAKPGVTKEAIVNTLQGVVNVRDVINVIRWLEHRGGVVEKEEGRYWGGREYLWCGVSV